MTDLPPGWERASLAEVIGAGLFSDGDWVESKDQDPEGDVRLLQLADIGEGQFRDRSDRHLTSGSASALGCTYVEKGDVLVARMPDPLGRACRVPSLDGHSVTAVDVCILRPTPTGVDPTWLMWAINAPQARSQIAALQSGTTRKRISRKNLATVGLAVPPRPEQERIVAAIEEHLSRLDAAESALRSAETRLDFLESRAVDEAFLSLDSRVPVGDLAAVRGGIQKQPKRKPKDNPAPFLRVANVGHGQMNLGDVHEVELFEGELERYRLRPGDLLVVEGNGSPDQIGRSAVWQGGIEDCVHQNHLIRVRPGPGLDPEFLGLYWNAPSTRMQLTAVASSTSGLYTLSTAKVKRVEVPVVPLTEQRAIAEQLTTQVAAFAQLRASLRTARARHAALRRSILAAAFSGQLVPQDPGDEPASALLERIRAERAAAAPTKRTRRAKLP